MLHIINGGIYRVFFNGTTNAEFSGLHPALIVRTLKESELYIVVPLTTYTKEKFKKTKSKGWGTCIKSINSIARIDKFQIIHSRDIKGRWKNEKGNMKIELEELTHVNSKLTEYVDLSSKKSEKEYEKYRNEYDLAFNLLKDVNETNKSNSLFTYNIIDNKETIQCCEKSLPNLSKADIYEIIDIVFDSQNVKIDYQNKNFSIIKK